MERDFMYRGIMTPRLAILYKKYEKKFGMRPDFYEDIYYAGDTPLGYLKYVSDIKKALKTGKDLAELHPLPDSAF